MVQDRRSALVRWPLGSHRRAWSLEAPFLVAAPSGFEGAALVESLMVAFDGGAVDPEAAGNRRVGYAFFTESRARRHSRDAQRSVVSYFRG